MAEPLVEYGRPICPRCHKGGTAGFVSGNSWTCAYCGYEFATPHEGYTLTPEQLLKRATVPSMTIQFISHDEWGTFVSLPDLLDALAASRTAGVEVGRDPYLLDQLHDGILEAHAKSKPVKQGKGRWWGG